MEDWEGLSFIAQPNPFLFGELSQKDFILMVIWYN